MNENNSVKINRDHQMDNIKAVLLFLVAFGHTLDVYKGDWNINMYLRNIYTYSICHYLHLLRDILQRIWIKQEIRQYKSV